MSDLACQFTQILERSPDELRENPPAGHKPRVLLFPVRYHYIGTAVEMVLGHSLRLHGARTDVILCDRFMPACDHRDIDRDTPEACRFCAERAAGLFDVSGLPVAFLSRFFDASSRDLLEAKVAAVPNEALIDMEYLGVGVGKIAYASTLRYFLRGRLLEEEHWRKFREFLVTALMMAEVSRRIIDEYQPDALVISHGIYVTWGVMAEYARLAGVRVTVWGYGYRRGSVLVSQGETYHKDLLEEPHENWRDRPFSDARREEVSAYLQSRVNGGLDWISYAPDPEVDRERIAETLSIDPDKPLIGLFTNLCWDAAVLFKGAAFPDMHAWLIETVRWAFAKPEVQLVIRCHPAEVRRRSQTREKAAEVVRAAFPDLPERIRLIPPESDISTYTLSEMIDLALVYSSKVGLEFAARGLAVVTAGEAFYREKGFTDDPATAAAYFERLDRLSRGERLPERKRELCLRYAYHYFFRRHVTISYFGDHGMGKDVTHFNMDDLSALLPGRDGKMDRFCEAVLKGASLFGLVAQDR